MSAWTGKLTCDVRVAASCQQFESILTHALTGNHRGDHDRGPWHLPHMMMLSFKPGNSPLWLLYLWTKPPNRSCVGPSTHGAACWNSLSWLSWLGTLKAGHSSIKMEPWPWPPSTWSSKCFMIGSNNVKESVTLNSIASSDHSSLMLCDSKSSTFVSDILGCLRKSPRLIAQSHFLRESVNNHNWQLSTMINHYQPLLYIIITHHLSTIIESSQP